MRILFISNDLIAGNLASLLKNEGHDVRLYIEEKERRANFENIVAKTENWHSELDWVGKDGLIFFDDVGYGAEQEKLRHEGYMVFGGGIQGDLLEKDRVHAQEIFSKYGMHTLSTHNFKTIDEAITHVKNHPKAWVIKQNGSSAKDLNYVGHFTDGRDVIDVLNTYKELNRNNNQTLTLQEKVLGIEIAVTGCFNGKNWIGSPLINIEHKKFLSGDLGPTTSEMGTIGWYEKDNALFTQTLEKLTPYLQEINYRGIIDINCIVNELGAFPLEATCRTGSPIIHLQTELNISPWGELLYALAKGQDYVVKYSKQHGIVVVLAVPPFPYLKYTSEHSHIGTHLYFDQSFKEDDMKHIHLEEVSVHPVTKQHYISDNRGYILYVTAQGKNITVARDLVYDLISKIYIPKLMYRNDIGLKFIEKNKKILTKLGYIRPWWSL